MEADNPSPKSDLLTYAASVLPAEILTVIGECFVAKLRSPMAATSDLDVTAAFTGKFRFTDLPTEIRTKIYGYLFPGHRISEHHMQQSCDLAILLVSRQFSAEAVDELYGFVEFALDLDIDKSDDIVMWSGGFLHRDAFYDYKQWTPLRKIKTLRLNVTLSDCRTLVQMAWLRSAIKALVDRLTQDNQLLSLTVAVVLEETVSAVVPDFYQAWDLPTTPFAMITSHQGSMHELTSIELMMAVLEPLKELKGVQKFRVELGAEWKDTQTTAKVEYVCSEGDRKRYGQYEDDMGRLMNGSDNMKQPAQLPLLWVAYKYFANFLRKTYMKEGPYATLLKVHNDLTEARLGGDVVRFRAGCVRLVRLWDTDLSWDSTLMDDEIRDARKQARFLKQGLFEYLPKDPTNGGLDCITEDEFKKLFR
ncbi:hypothetical protein LTS18_011034 [Coniosporium uncinatum]|uniref:Uncharacterized protein n=1 Tax=Coniosporium uncinatum TaxID=93489 RepID=A0ACC3CYW7_9PEZI|nr:hypothetical protein LTS18_011034 [Coniosporium uncinatum]